MRDWYLESLIDAYLAAKACESWAEIQYIKPLTKATDLAQSTETVLKFH